MKYEKCPRCELNYKTAEEAYCSVCRKQLTGKDRDEEDGLFDVCPFCERYPLRFGEEMCEKCRNRQKETQGEKVFSVVEKREKLWYTEDR